MKGNGYCSNVNGYDNVARRYYVGMSHEEARQICQLDEGCVAYTYSLDPYIAKESSLNVVLYSTTLCTADCGITTWKDNPYLITQARNQVGSSNWNTAKCYIKRKYADFNAKCNLRH